MRFLYRCSPVLLLFTLLASSAAQFAFPTTEDLRHFRSVSEPRLSPNGKQVLFRITEATADGAASHLWLADLTANTSRQITFSSPTDKRGESSGDWMPDGSILFLARRGEHTQLFRLPPQFGEARPFDLKTAPLVDVTKLPNYIDTSVAEKSSTPKPPEKAEDLLPINVSNYSAAPDGRTIAIIAADPETAAETKQTKDKADANWVNHDVHGRRLYLLDPETSKITLSSIPPNVENVAWSADSSRLIVVTGPQNDLGDLGPVQKAYVLEVAHPDRPSLLEKLPPTMSGAEWSKDGRTIYFLAQAQRDTPPDFVDLYQYDATGQQVRNLTDGFSGSVEHERPISLLGGGVFKAVATGVTTTAIIVRIDKSLPETLRFQTSLVGSFHTNARQTGWVFLGASSTQPTAIYYTDSIRQPARAIAIPKLTPVNDHTVSPRRIVYPSDKLKIEALLYLPPEAASKKVPLIVDVHGGPSGAFQDGYDLFVAWLNGQGWAVLRSNIRGSTNYGAEFVAANKNDLGGGDYRDVMNGVDYVLKNFPLDESRMALIGYSYGGEMAGFVEGKTNRFKAIVSGAPVIDQFSEYGTENGSWYDRWYFGKPWEHVEDAWRQSPLAGASKASTPFLLLQGADDKTDPLGESQQMYRALRQMGVPVELVVYPREDHGPLARGMFGGPSQEPWHGLDARRHILRFLQKEFESAK